MLDEIRANEAVNISDNTINKLRADFPSCFTNEGKFDWLKFKELLSDNIDITNEGYELNFLGKSYAKYLTSLDEDTLLIPDEEHNKQDINRNSQNVYITGDNFDSMKHLLNSYRGLIKCIYLDPPYNTGSDGFTYHDKFSFTVPTLMEKLNLGEKEAERVLDLTTRGSASHSAWCMFMLPRLLMARDLLTNDGIVVISIDESEHANLRLLCDDVFDERNYAGEIIWKNSSKNDQDYISMQHEYILFYVKNKDINKGQWKEKKEGLDEIFKAFEGFRKQTDDPDEIHKLALEWYKQFSEANPIYGSKHYSWYDDIKGVYFPDNISGPKFGQYVYDVVHPVTGKVVKAPASGWRYPESSMLELISNGGVHFGKDESVIPNKKTYLVDTQYQSLTSIKFKDGRVASKMIEKLLGDAKYFSNPKDVDLMASIFTALEIGNNDIVLDVFSGSGTTAHTVMKMNAEKGTNIRYIHLQLDEAVKEKDAPYKAGYRTIDEIGRARIEASAKLVQEETGADIDYGYTHYYIKQLEDDSIEKMEEFDPEVYIVNNSINDEIGENIILSTWLCKDGYGFNPDVKEIDLDGYKAYYCGKHLYLIGRQFTKDNVNALIKMYVDPYKINEKTASNIINRFSDWKYNNLKGHFSYKKADIPVVRTALTNLDGTPVDAITKLYIGSKDADGAINKNYLYNSLAHDSDLELENIRADIDSVVVYGKIPRRSIAIPTIDGQTYSPDFMYLLKQKDGTQTLNLVVETKDYEHEADLRKAEGYRIECAEEFFKALKADGINVTFERQLRNDKMVSIIGDILNK